MEFVDLKRQQAALGDGIKRRIDRVLEHGQFIMGPEIGELERKLADFSGVKHCISCASGTDALLLALMAYGVKPGDAVFTTPFTFIATAEVIALLGATPVFVDIDPSTFNIDPGSLERAISDLEAGRIPSPGTPRGLRPRGVIPVDLFGLAADYDAINAVAARRGMFVLEDAAQSFGAVYSGRMACGLAETAATSFFPAKPLGCYGDGGAVFTNDDRLADVAQSLRIHGKGKDKYDNIRIGINGRLDTLQAAILLSKLEIFPSEMEARRRVAVRYTAALEGVVETPYVPEGSESAWAQYSILPPDRAALQESLKRKGIPSMIYYPTPLHRQTAFAGLGYGEGSLPVSEESARRILSLPMHPYLQDQEIEAVVEAVKAGCLERKLVR